METGTSWGDETVSLDSWRAEAEGTSVDEAAKTSPLEGYPAGRTETVVLHGSPAGRSGSFFKIGWHDSPLRGALQVAAPGLAVILMALALASLFGDGGDRVQLRASSLIGQRSDHHSSGRAFRIKEIHRSLKEREVRAAQVPKERRRLREHRRRDGAVATTKAAAAAEAAPTLTPDAEAEYMPDYPPEPVPEAVPAPEAAPPAADSSTPPDVEFGM